MTNRATDQHFKRMKGTGHIAESKYRDAISLYTDTDLSIKEICEKNGLGFSAFSSYLSKRHRDLILKRHGLTEFKNVRLRGKRGQTTESHYKYKHAIEACDSMEYIEYNISQIARIFSLDASALSNQLRRHYPEIVPRRELKRRQMGISVNLQYGARHWCKKEYTDAVEMLKSSDMTIEEAANAGNVSHTGLREHILAYHPLITRTREERRIKAKGQKVPGMRNGNWAIHEPSQGIVDKYEEAIDLYRTTSMEIKEIARTAGVNIGGFRHHLRTWHPELMVQRRGFDESVDFGQTKRYSRTTAEKYAAAIDKLKTSDLPTTKIAAEFGLKYEAFRVYLKEHYPELTDTRGIAKNAKGKLVSNHSAKKYAEALSIYENTSESLRSIAQRLGLTYNSINGYIRRNHPEVIAKHKSRIEELKR